MLPFQVNVSIVGFNSLVREGISRILSESEFKNFEFYGSAEEAVVAVEGSSPGMAIVDLKVSDASLRDLVELKSSLPSVYVVLMADGFDFRQMVAAFQSGAHAYLLKEIGAHPLIDSLRLVSCGEKVLPSALLQHLPDTQMLSEHRAEVQVQLSELLSEREIDTLRYLVMGYPNKVIAYRLDISEATVKVHVKAILRKLMVQNRTQAAIWAVNQGLITGTGEYAEALSSEVANLAVVSEMTRPAPTLACTRSV